MTIITGSAPLTLMGGAKPQPANKPLVSTFKPFKPVTARQHKRKHAFGPTLPGAAFKK